MSLRTGWRKGDDDEVDEDELEESSSSGVSGIDPNICVSPLTTRGAMRAS